MHIIMVLLLGIATGMVSGLLGVGGGLLMVPIFTHIFKMDIHKAIGTSLAIIVPIALVGSTRHFLNGNIEFRNLAFFVVAALIGGWLGATLANVLPVPVLKRLFAIFLVCVAVHMFLSAK
jgi:hypothetical protein